MDDKGCHPALLVSSFLLLVSRKDSVQILSGHGHFRAFGKVK